jgi:hypothetical protein
MQGVNASARAPKRRLAVLYQRPFQLTCAHARDVIEVTVLGSLAKRFHAAQQASTMAS